MADDPDDPWAYFGKWSAAGIVKVTNILDSLGVRFEVNDCVDSEEVLRDWCAWDETSSNPNAAFNLWVHEGDRLKLGDKIVVMFPERKFGE